MRHWFGRFKGKSIIVSKSIGSLGVEEINTCIVANFRVNGSIIDIFEKTPNYHIS